VFLEYWTTNEFQS